MTRRCPKQSSDLSTVVDTQDPRICRVDAAKSYSGNLWLSEWAIDAIEDPLRA